MLRTTLKKNPFILTLLGVVGVLMLALSLDSFTWAQSKKGEAVVELKDAVERLGPNQIRAKAGFRLVVDGDGWVVEQVKGKEVRRLVKRVKCGVCPGGSCRARLNGACVPRITCDSVGCLIDPF